VLVGKLREKTINIDEFRIYSRRIIRLIIEEALAIEHNEFIIKESPLGYYRAPHNPRNSSDYIAISILRSGNSMVDEIIALIPDIPIGQILLQRDDTREDKRPIFFFEKIPKNIEEKKIILLDPMLGGGGSASVAIDILINKKGVKEENIIFLNLIGCPEGISVLFGKYPKIKIVSAKIDPLLLPIKYIAPGIGDFGDRFYGTDH